MRYKLLATDLDGTLNNSQGAISAGNKEAVRRAVNAGLNIVICSGRSQNSVAKFNQELELTVPGSYGISFNGGVVYKADTMEVIYEHRMPKDDCLEVDRAVRAIFPETPVMVYAEGGLIYYTHDNINIDSYTNNMAIDCKKVESFDELPGDIMKIIIRWDPEKLVQIYEGVKDRLHGICDMVFSAAHLLEFSPTGSNKSAGLQVLAEYLGIGMDEVVAVGDHFNDAEMIRDAGLGVAVKNAVADIKTIAGYVTKNDNDNDAIKEVIELIMAAQL